MLCNAPELITFAHHAAHRGIKKEIRMERAKEQIKRESDAENLKRVAEQNAIHLAHLKQQKGQEIADVRKLEAEWAEVLNKQERARDRQLKQTYSRQAISYGRAASMQETMDRIAREDEERANRHAKELEDAAAKREYDQKAERARLQRETLDVLAIQVRRRHRVWMPTDRATRWCWHASGRIWMHRTRRTIIGALRRGSATRCTRPS